MPTSNKIFSLTPFLLEPKRSSLKPLIRLTPLTRLKPLIRLTPLIRIVQS